MRIALCNEVLAERDFAAQCAYAAALGYDGLEVAPFTLADEPQRIDAGTCATLRRAASNAGIAITGLHWLLVKPTGLSITTADAAVRAHGRRAARAGRALRRARGPLPRPRFAGAAADPRRRSARHGLGARARAPSPRRPKPRGRRASPT